MARQQLNVRLPQATLDRLREMCRITGLSQSKVIEQLVEKASVTPAVVTLSSESGEVKPCQP